jgi:predicted phage baseplate assembly protein
VEFEFLSKLPKSNLDDRDYKDLVDECLLRIPRYCPEWTNFNPSDPGVTMVELFAWLTDQMLFRFNQVPRRNYITFLEMLGIRLKAPEPSHTEVTFYLTRPQAADDRFDPIKAGTEIATESIDGEEAVVFSTDRDLEIGIPKIAYLLTSETAHRSLMPANVIQSSNVSDPNARQAEAQQEQARQQREQLRRQGQIENNQWVGRDQPVFRLQPQAGNCFYLVFEPGEALDGNVLVLTISGEPAGPTGIDPRRPPRHWEAWDGSIWRPILRHESEDGTLGFSFDEGEQAMLSGVKTAEVKLHMPIAWPVTSFEGYAGRWLRCVYRKTEDAQAGYRYSPLFNRVTARSIGGSITASQCTIVTDELLGESNGKSGQVFELQAQGILPRDVEAEYVVLKPPPELQSLDIEDAEEVWCETEDFADSRSIDRHYTLDSITGRIQFGPLIQESGHLREEVQMRRRVQKGGYEPASAELDTLDLQEKQYGVVPPKGWTVRMKQYRTGGGSQGNVPPETIRILKTALPYVEKVVNYKSAQGGTDAESLEEAIIRVPRLLRTANRAVTPEDFETLTLQSSSEVGRAYCPRNYAVSDRPAPGVVQVFVVPRVREEMGQPGLSPDRLQLSQGLQTEVMSFLDQRRLLGIEVQLKTPNYVGVSVQAELSLAPEYRSAQAEADIRRKILDRLYGFLNPLSGGRNSMGWRFGELLYRADVAALLQQMPGVRYLKFVELYSYGLSNGQWERSYRQDGVIDPGSFGLLCSWDDAQLRSGHIIRFSEEENR